VTQIDLLQSVEELEKHYNAPSKLSRYKSRGMLTTAMQKWLSFSPFFIVSTCGTHGLDCSPRGDEAGKAFRILDAHTIAFPDRRGNNRIDSLRNMIVDPRIGLLFFVPGVSEALRIKGEAVISVAPDLLTLFEQDGLTPATVIVISINEVYIQNARAIRSSGLWEIANSTDVAAIPDAAQLSKDD